jgi:primosomal replication protein N
MNLMTYQKNQPPLSRIYNNWIVTKQLFVEKSCKLGVLRYTPAGVAIIEFTIHHVSRQMEAGVARQIICEVLAVAMGKLALTIAEFQINSAWLS